MSESLLFDKSPLEGEGQSKKKGGRRKSRQDEPRPFVAADDHLDDRPSPLGFLLSLDSVPCGQCGAPADLAEVVVVNGRKWWRVQCGWWCMHSWLISPIPGLLEEQDRKRRDFVLREGRFAGKTFGEVWDSGNEWYIRELASLSRSDRISAAAADWLAKKNA